MRLWVHCAYDGTDFHGWQIQPNALTIQGVLQERFAIFTKQSIEIVGCGRTDTGVHASQYFFHFDLAELPLPIETLLYKWNALLPSSISIYNLIQVDESLHARFSAISRGYIYRILKKNNPFLNNHSFVWNQKLWPSADKLNEVAELLTQYSSFEAFCKSNSGLENFDCTIVSAQWIETKEGLEFHISANRFLRGMVRLISGACLQYAMNKISKQEIIKALNDRTPLEKGLSVPAKGLTLCKVEYPGVRVV
jgi:tRNA pseudouridine38-40 synthase